MKVEIAHVYRAENGRRYFTRKAAAAASIRYRMRKAYPEEKPEYQSSDGRMTYPGWHWTCDERLVRIADYLTKRILRTR